MPKYNVVLPIAGAISIDEVEANDEDEAIEKAIDMAGEDFITIKDSETCTLDALEIFTHIVEGNVLYPDQNDAEAVELEDID